MSFGFVGSLHFNLLEDAVNKLRGIQGYDWLSNRRNRIV
jgi:hypothetical protein